jgi:hypothetical protein
MTTDFLSLYRLMLPTLSHSRRDLISGRVLLHLTTTNLYLLAPQFSNPVSGTTDDVLALIYVKTGKYECP